MIGAFTSLPQSRLALRETSAKHAGGAVHCLIWERSEDGPLRVKTLITSALEGGTQKADKKKGGCVIVTVTGGPEILQTSFKYGP